jgi:PII-like signaling protein
MKRRYIEAYLLRIFIGENDRYEGRPLYEAIVRKVRQMGFAGATVLRGIEGFGKSSRLHTARLLRLSEDLPIVIEIVDEEAEIEQILDAIEPMVQEGLVTLEKVRVIKYSARGHDTVQERFQPPTD